MYYTSHPYCIPCIFRLELYNLEYVAVLRSNFHPLYLSDNLCSNRAGKNTPNTEQAKKRTNHEGISEAQRGMRLMKYALNAGLLINLCYLLAKRFIGINDAASTVVCLISSALMTAGIIYSCMCPDSKKPGCRVS